MDSKTPPKPEGTVTKKELRNKYKVSTETFRKMLKELNLNTRDKILFPFQLGMIYARYGSP